jgi:hypothetical protein
MARFACSLLFGAAWTAWGARSALAGAAVALAVCAAYALTLRPRDERDTPRPRDEREGTSTA